MIYYVIIKLALLRNIDLGFSWDFFIAPSRGFSFPYSGNAVHNIPYNRALFNTSNACYELTILKDHSTNNSYKKRCAKHHLVETNTLDHTCTIKGNKKTQQGENK